VIRYDHRDTGCSTHRDFQKNPYAVADLAKDAVAVLEGYGIDRAHAVGLSMGGSIGQILAIDHRERLLTLTVIMTAALDVDFVGNIGRALRGEISPDGRRHRILGFSRYLHSVLYRVETTKQSWHIGLRNGGRCPGVCSTKRGPQATRKSNFGTYAGIEQYSAMSANINSGPLRK
jgi:pimeloyl-ACP methyl ester carboxylesterase